MSGATSEFEVEVPDVGTFVFRRRTARLDMAIVREALEFIGGPAQTEWQMQAGDAWGALRIQTVTAPDGWDLDQVDLLDPDDFAKLRKVFGSLRDAEARFRRGAGEGGEVPRA